MASNTAPEGEIHGDTPATARLRALCAAVGEGKHSSVDEETLLDAVLHGNAEVQAPCGRSDRRSILHALMASGSIRAVRACLSTPHPIDFTAVDPLSGRPLLHAVFEPGVCDAACGLLVDLIVGRLASHPTDVVDWGQMDKRTELDFTSAAAASQRLSLVWPVVCEQPWFADHTQPIAVTWRVWSWDWERLLTLMTEEERAATFAIDDPAMVIAASEATARLYAACQASSWEPGAAEVRSCVEAGADLMFVGPDASRPLLLQLMREGQVEAVRACLASPRPLDFRRTGSWGQTALHAVCDARLRPSETVAMMEAVVARLFTAPRWQRERLPAASPHAQEGVEIDLTGGACFTPSGDCVNWWQEDDFLEDFLQTAASAQRLSGVWKAVKAVPACVPSLMGSRGVVRPGSGTQRIALHKAWEFDWRGIDAGDREAYFDIRPSAIIRGDAATARLLVMCESHHWGPPPSEVEALVREGADVRPVLERFLYSGNLPCIAALLATPAALDFSSRTSGGASTLLHDICRKCRDAAGVCGVLHLIFDRLERTGGEGGMPWRCSITPCGIEAEGGGGGADERNPHECAPPSPPRDRVDWEAVDGAGHNFFSAAAARGMLSAVREVLKQRGVVPPSPHAHPSSEDGSPSMEGDTKARPAEVRGRQASGLKK